MTNVTDDDSLLLVEQYGEPCAIAVEEELGLRVFVEVNHPSSDADGHFKRPRFGIG